MTDLVKRLRRNARGIVGVDQDRMEAADEIERLRKALEESHMNNSKKRPGGRSDDEVKWVREKLIKREEDSLKNIRCTVIEDMRKWADSGLDEWRPNIARRVIDAYERDQKAMLEAQRDFWRELPFSDF